MFIITREQTIGWLDRMVELSKLHPIEHQARVATLTNYIAMQRGPEPMAFNDFMAAIGLQVYDEYQRAKLNPITLDDNCDPNPSGPVGSDPGPSVQP
jgi:hypothetical protein